MATTNENMIIVRALALPSTLSPNTIYLVPGAAGGLDITVVGKTTDVKYTSSGVSDLETTIETVVKAMTDITVSPENVTGLLDDNGIIKMSMLPNTLDNLETVPTFNDLDVSKGSKDTLYVTEDTNTLYRWSPTANEGQPGFVPMPAEVGAALKLEYERTIALSGEFVSGSTKFDGSQDVEIDVIINKVPGEKVEGAVPLADALSDKFGISLTGDVTGTAALAADGKSLTIETTVAGASNAVEDGTYVKVTTSNGFVTAGETKLLETDLPDTISGSRIAGPVASASALVVDAEW